jgi:hypothetical protein
MVAMSDTVLLNHDDRAKAKTVQDALLNSLGGFFIAGSSVPFLAREFNNLN